MEHFRRALAALLAFGYVTASAFAATYQVTVDESGFSPSQLTINQGDEVLWISVDETFPHTTTSDLFITDPNYWNGPLFSEGEYFLWVFENAGVFDYGDAFTSNTGTITVLPVTPTVIELTAPRREGNQFLFDVTGLTVGRSVVLEGSTNLVNWTAISTNQVQITPMTITDSIGPAHKFFRVYQTPE